MPTTNPSPPTRRVIDVVELLLNVDSALSTTEVSRRLGITRPTATAILAELEAAGWTQRDGALAHSIGPALARVGAQVSALPALLAGAALTELARATQCGVTMSLIGSDHLVVVDKKHGGRRVIPGLPTGQRMPLEFPVGAAVMPWRTPSERAHWLATAGHHPDELLRRVRKFGFAIFRPNDSDAGLVDVLADLLGAVGAELVDPTVRTRALRQLNTLTARAYTDAEIRSAKPLPISYLTAPVFDEPGHARFEVQLGPLRQDVTKRERDDYVVGLLEAAQQISGVLQGG